MTEREQRIITFFSKYGALSKKELAGKEGMSWATAVKLVSRLEQAGILQCIGSESQPETTGKNPLLYDLADRHPLAIGIDVSYSVTHLLLTNLKKSVIAHTVCKTIQHPTAGALQEFLVERCREFIKKHLNDDEMLKGIGIGIPLWLTEGKHSMLTDFRHVLEGELQTPVRIENNVRNYALYKKWAGKAFALDDFIVITIRNGIGTGIFYRGELWRGAHGIAGELSHLTLIEEGKLCRCGQRGCLETVVNQDVLYQDYRQYVRQKPLSDHAQISETEFQAGLADLFTRARHNETEALKIVKRTAKYLGRGIATLLKILDIPNIFIAADFGMDGDVFLPHLRQEVDSRLFSDIDYSLAYYPLEPLGFVQGAALSILQDYFIRL